jgi:hypothetical protein
MTEPKADISLTSILPRLPAEAQQWINDLPPRYRQSTEYLLNLVGGQLRGALANASRGSNQVRPLR